MDNQEVTNNVDITWLIYQSAVGWIPIIMDLITFHGFIIGIGSNQQYGLCKQLRRDKWTGWEFNVNSPMKRGPLPCPCGGCESLINMGLKWIWNWLVVWNMLYFPYIGNFTIPTDELICFRQVETTKQENYHPTYGLLNGGKPWIN